MNRYIAKIIYQVICGEGKHASQFDEQVRLIEAADLADAYTNALEIGVNEEDGFMNNKQQLVQWKFISVAELYELDDFCNGTELSSSLKEIENADNYIQLLKAKSRHLHQRISESYLLTL
jgi:hypothetical protein